MLWLLVLALLGGTLQLHSEAAGHGADPGHLALSGHGAGEEVFVCADGHGPGAHLERALAVERHDCAACLHRLQVHGGDLLASILPGEGGPGAVAPAERPVAARAPVLERSPSRGPPAA